MSVAEHYLAEMRRQLEMPPAEARFYDAGGADEREYLLLRGGLKGPEAARVGRLPFRDLSKAQAAAARNGYLRVMRECDELRERGGFVEA